MRLVLVLLVLLPFPIFAQDAQLLYSDPFMSVGSPPQGWTLSGNWIINADEELQASGSRNAIALASPAFAGCGICRLETTVEASRGNTSFLAWYSDPGNYVELSIKPDPASGENVWRLRQVINGLVAAQAKGRQAQLYPSSEVRIVYDGLRFTVQIDERAPLIVMNQATPPFGTAGYHVRRGTARFKFLNIYSS